MLYELELRMSKAQLYLCIPPTNHKLFTTVLYTHESPEPCDQTDICKECMSSNNETVAEKDTNLRKRCSASEELQRCEKEKESKCDENSQDDINDSGYHTPTSPERTIAPVLRCPPAPERPKCVRYIKRKVRVRYKHMQILVPDEQVVSFFDCELKAGRMRKKARLAGK